VRRRTPAAGDEARKAIARIKTIQNEEGDLTDEDATEEAA